MATKASLSLLGLKEDLFHWIFVYMKWRDSGRGLKQLSALRKLPVASSYRAMWWSSALRSIPEGAWSCTFVMTSTANDTFSSVEQYIVGNVSLSHTDLIWWLSVLQLQSICAFNYGFAEVTTHSNPVLKFRFTVKVKEVISVRKYQISKNVITSPQSFESTCTQQISFNILNLETSNVFLFKMKYAYFVIPS